MKNLACNFLARSTAFVYKVGEPDGSLNFDGAPESLKPGKLVDVNFDDAGKGKIRGAGGALAKLEGAQGDPFELHSDVVEDPYRNLRAIIEGALIDKDRDLGESVFKEEFKPLLDQLKNDDETLNSHVYGQLLDKFKQYTSQSLDDVLTKANSAQVVSELRADKYNRSIVVYTGDSWSKLAVQARRVLSAYYKKPINTNKFDDVYEFPTSAPENLGGNFVALIDKDGSLIVRSAGNEAVEVKYSYDSSKDKRALFSRLDDFRAEDVERFA